MKTTHTQNEVPLGTVCYHITMTPKGKKNEEKTIVQVEGIEPRTVNPTHQYHTTEPSLLTGCSIYSCCIYLLQI